MAEQKYDVNEPSRRRLLKGIGALGGALAITGGCPVAHAAKDNSSPGTLSPNARMEAQPFYGPHQAGVLTPQQASMPLLAVPYRPSWIEHLILSNRNILADQMAFLKSHLPKRNPRSQ